MLSDIEIAQKAKMRPIEEIAKKAGIKTAELEFYGQYKAKVHLSPLKRLKKKKDGHLILVTTMTPTPQGEGKTTTTIGLAEALQAIKKKTFACIREPSLGPVMGMKGGAAGGGYSQVIPMDDINLHLTGDMHMITSAHNLLTAMIYNHIYQGNKLKINPNAIVWKRVMDMNDRALRGLFEITAASEVMAILCLSTSVTDMKKRLGDIIIAYNISGKPIRAKDIKAHGAMALLMWHALRPNLVQTLEGGPAFIHGGPFANIAHGCNSLIATQMALKLADYVVTEAGFGTDLGAEKFFNIKCRVGGLKPAAVVLVVTKQALKAHGYDNLSRHLKNVQAFGIPVVIAINKKGTDTDKDMDLIKANCVRFEGIPCVVSDVWARGGKGGAELAKTVVDLCQQKSKLVFSYAEKTPLQGKIETIAKQVYGAVGVNFTPEAQEDLELMAEIGLANVPVCIAKTQYSLSDNSSLSGRPKNFKITVTKVKPSAGAGFVVAYTGKIMTMPGLPKHPAAEDMDVSEDGKIKGLF
ncbi:MAG: formate--tetrahydrofolate ligase [bacterium]